MVAVIIIKIITSLLVMLMSVLPFLIETTGNTNAINITTGICGDDRGIITFWPRRL